MGHYIDYEKVDARTAARLKKLIEKSYGSYWKKKRAFDLVTVTLLLIPLILPMLLLALIVFIDDPHGSPFYKQVRIGRHGKPFYMYKFRSMYVDADKRKTELMERNEMDGPVFKMKNEPRITRVGRIIRKLSIDEHEPRRSASGAAERGEQLHRLRQTPADRHARHHLHLADFAAPQRHSF